MKLGVTSYSMARLLRANQMDIFQVMNWIAGQGGVHVEIAPGDYIDMEEPKLPERIRDHAAQLGLVVSNYAVGGNFIEGDKENLEREIEQAFRQVDIAFRLGVSRMRHDAAWRAREETTPAQFEADIDRIAEACRRIADYAAPLGITTSIENHGFHVQSSERVLRLIHEVDRPNFRLTMDIGNFMCADENSVAAVRRAVPYASMIHLKDFYWRPSHRDQGQGWFKTRTGDYLRGAILGNGDIDMREVLRIIKQSGYDGFLSVEFEGAEDCLNGTSIGLENARKMWNAV
ncbi:sugar phosphate isomerase/epimerase family protein [Paenibacillus agaridevorans]|uniref:sugar phosphate isomerase/epimerase family protein n=1 Tax=Paenibacillus agaridevorans TaxID=171404 RepID=UPI001BE434DA|nr:sugar phosphate isomerase/epimerase family protein [Paenibacillus agaridevorans]